MGVEAGLEVRLRTMQPLEHIRVIADRVARSRGLEVWDIVSRREPSGQVIRVFIDRPGTAATPEESVGIEDCVEVKGTMSASGGTLENTMVFARRTGVVKLRTVLVRGDKRETQVDMELVSFKAAQ